MSSNISTAFDAIKTKMGTLFPSHIQLSNPYDIEENTIAALELGWGVALGPGTNSNRNLSCNMSIQRTITITITRRRYANELDTESKESAEKSLLEDHYTLIKALEKENTLNSTTSGIARFVYLSDAGIEVVDTTSDSYIKISTEFELEYFEDLN